MAVEGNAVSSDCFSPEFRQDLIRLISPPFRDKLSRCRSPHLFITLNSRCIPPDKSALGNLDDAAKAGILESNPVDQLRDWRIYPQELAYKAGQVRETIQSLTRRIDYSCPDDFGPELVLNGLKRERLVEVFRSAGVG